MAIGFSTLATLVQDLVIWDTVRLLSWFHPAHGLGGNAYAMANCGIWPNCAILDAVLVAFCDGMPILRKNECPPVCILTIGPPSIDSEIEAPGTEPLVKWERFPDPRIPWLSAGECPS